MKILVTVLLLGISVFALCAVSTAAELKETDPDFVGIMENFLKEVDARNSVLSVKQKEYIKITALATQQSREMLKLETENALKLGLTPVEIKEAALQCAPYAGLPRAADAFKVIDEVFAAKKIALPLESRSNVSEKTRFEKGLDAQATLFGEGMRERAKPGPNKISPINYYLITNCFGDYYTRDGLDLATREMLTLVVLVNIGTEPQIKAHINGNKNMGRDKSFIAAMIYECLPYMGYPRTLNALACLNEVMPD